MTSFIVSRKKNILFPQKHLHNVSLTFGKFSAPNQTIHPQAKASISVDAYRAGFDVSLPLFHPSHPMRDGASGKAGSNTFPANDRYFIAFKGKRYVYGIGSETR